MSLQPTTPNQSSRYAIKQSSGISPMVVPGLLGNPTANDLPQYLPPQWATHIHPEGQRYFHRKADLSQTSDFDIVTEANLYCTDTLDQVLSCIKEFQAQISEGVQLPEGTELLLQIDHGVCCYYLVNHKSRKLFWLEALDTEELGLPAVASPSHLDQYLTAMYWTHVEYFPMHKRVMDCNFIDELTSIFSHGHIDVLTSSSSTFPFTADDCANFTQILRNSRDQTSDGHVIWTAARLAALIHNHRASMHFGEGAARLSLDQSLFPEPAFEDVHASQILSRLTFSTSRYYMSQLNSLFIDRTVYTRHWRSFWRQTLREWDNIRYTSMAVVLLHLLFYFVQDAIPGLIILSAIFVGVSMLSSITLTLQHETFEKVCSTGGYDYLAQARSENYGFLWTAFKFALPKASLIWGLTFFTLNWLAILILYICNNFPVPFHSGWIAAPVLGCFGVFAISRLWRKLRELRRGMSNKDIDIV